jgi:hypothetical protein
MKTHATSNTAIGHKVLWSLSLALFASLAQVEIDMFKIVLAGFDFREIEDIVNDAKQRFA